MTLVVFRLYLVGYMRKNEWKEYGVFLSYYQIFVITIFKCQRLRLIFYYTYHDGVKIWNSKDNCDFSHPDIT